MELLNYWWSKTNSDHLEIPASPLNGPPATAEEVFLSHTPRVYNLARRMLGNDADAEDVTQDVFLQVVRKLDTFRGDAELTTWLHKVVVNAVLLHRRRQANRNHYQAGDQLELFLHDPSSAQDRRPVSEAPDQRLLDEEMRDLLEEAISRLPEVYRDVYVLADVEECANADIGEALGLSLPAVKSRLHRARLLMRKILAPHFEEASA
jgi:RNA polymerase sigma-70 factor, ECF subfamily